MTPTDPVMYIVVRRDLELSYGKFGAQVGHAVQLALRIAEDHGSPFLYDWEHGSYAKVVLGVESLPELLALDALLTRSDVSHVLVVDEGRTEVEAGTQTAIGLAPLPRETAKLFVGKLRLYR